MFDLDAHLRLHTESLKLSAKRSEVLARNLANAETPNYKAVDFDFQHALAAATGADVAMVVRRRAGGDGRRSLHLRRRVASGYDA